MPPPNKRRKTSAIEEITFDDTARHDYLTGFHKRKLARIKHAQEEAAKKEREEKILERKKLKEQRSADLAKHIETVNALLHEANGRFDGNDDEEDGDEEDGDEGWKGFEDQPINVEDQYVDEDKFTMVTVESVNISKDGMDQIGGDSDEESEENETKASHEEAAKPNKAATNGLGPNKRVWTKEKPKNDRPKKKKKKFRYESPAERKMNRSKQRAKNKTQADARRAAAK